MASASIARAEPGAPIGVRGKLRIVRRVGLLVLAVLVYVPLHYAWKLAGRRSPWPPRFLGLAARIAGARPRVVGRPLRHDVLCLANHISWIDILAMGGASGTAFVAKSEIGQAPVVGWLAGLNNTLYVTRGDRLGVAAQIAALARAIAGPQPVTIFGEGTTGDGHVILPFKASLLAVLDPPPPGIRVQPVFLDYGDAVFDLTWLGAETGLQNALRILSRPGGFVLTLRYLAPFDPADLPGGRKAIAIEAHRRVADALAIAQAAA
jgi:1-acyl-sn-glycerol-3-phosphate acyltransferase